MLTRNARRGARAARHHHQQHRTRRHRDAQSTPTLLNDPVKLRSLLDQIPLDTSRTSPTTSRAWPRSSPPIEAAYVTGSTYFVDGGLTVFYTE